MQANQTNLNGILDAGQTLLGLHLEKFTQDKLLEFLQLLAKWGRIYNLTAIRDPQQMLVQHLLDSLALVPVLQQLLPAPAIRLLDVGSGAGLPGIPLALALPQAQIVSVDTVEKKIAFQRQAKASLGLENFTPIHLRVEQMSCSEKFNVITARAFADLEKIVQLTEPMVADTGYIVAMKGQVPEEEIAHLTKNWLQWRVESVPRLQIPGLAAARCAVILKRRKEQGESKPIEL